MEYSTLPCLLCCLLLAGVKPQKHKLKEKEFSVALVVCLYNYFIYAGLCWELCVLWCSKPPALRLFCCLMVLVERNGISLDTN